MTGWRSPLPMPWCDSCSRFWNPPSLAEGGACPTCGRVLLAREAARAPWHFKLMVGALIVYLAFRAWEGVEWVIGRF